MLKGRAIPISLWILIGSIIGGLLLLALIIFILWKVCSCCSCLHISSGKWMFTESVLISFSLPVSWDSSHANREERMRTMRTEPNFYSHDDNSHLPWRLRGAELVLGCGQIVKNLLSCLFLNAFSWPQGKVRVKERCEGRLIRKEKGIVVQHCCVSFPKGWSSVSYAKLDEKGSIEAPFLSQLLLLLPLISG